MKDITTIGNELKKIKMVHRYFEPIDIIKNIIDENGNFSNSLTKDEKRLLIYRICASGRYLVPISFDLKISVSDNHDILRYEKRDMFVKKLRDYSYMRDKNRNDADVFLKTNMIIVDHIADDSYRKTNTITSKLVMIERGTKKILPFVDRNGRGNEKEISIKINGPNLSD
jgi:hypothetical protein